MLLYGCGYHTDLDAILGTSKDLHPDPILLGLLELDIRVLVLLAWRQESSTGLHVKVLFNMEKCTSY